MGNMDSWDLTLMVVAAYLAIAALVRLMNRHRNQVIEKFRQEAEKEKKRKQLQNAMRDKRQRTA